MENKSVKNTSLDMSKWREIIDNWNKSGESQKAYCNRIGVNLNTFTYARVKLHRQEKSKLPFAPLTIKPNDDDSLSNQSAIILENNRGYKLYFPVSLSLDQFSKLFKLSGWIDA